MGGEKRGTGFPSSGLSQSGRPYRRAAPPSLPTFFSKRPARICNSKNILQDESHPGGRRPPLIRPRSQQCRHSSLRLPLRRRGSVLLPPMPPRNEWLPPNRLRRPMAAPPRGLQPRPLRKRGLRQTMSQSRAAAMTMTTPLTTICPTGKPRAPMATIQISRGDRC